MKLVRMTCEFPTASCQMAIRKQSAAARRTWRSVAPMELIIDSLVEAAQKNGSF